MIQFLNSLWENESGVTSVEYALLAAAAAVVLSVAGGNFYTKVSGAFDDISLAAESEPEVVPGG